jgi:hypothetical protein
MSRVLMVNVERRVALRAAGSIFHRISHRVETSL